MDTLTILVAENDPNDVVFLQKAFKKNAIASPVFFCESGEELIAYLKGEGQFSDRSEYPFPRVLITDLKMPRCGGFEVLQWLKKNPRCSVLPCIVMSNSDAAKDVEKAFRLGASAYFKKPSSFTKLCDIVRLNWAFWTESILPPIPEKC